MVTSRRSGRRDQLAVLAGLAGVVCIAWVYLFGRWSAMQAPVEGHGAPLASMAAMGAWTTKVYVLTLLMWAVMMVGMMLPSATPMTLLYAAVARKARNDADPLPPTTVFVAGYVTVWALFSIVATTAQLALDRAALLSPAIVSASPVLGGALLVGAGAYQLTPIKQVCLRHCRAPAHFISQHWRKGTTGAFVMGLHHGLYCLGCCWVLMGLLFVGGVMNLLWVAAIALFVLLEKTMVFGELGGRLAGAAMIVLGALGLLGPLTFG